MHPTHRTVKIDCFPSSAALYRDGHVVVAIDVIRATTMVVTALSLGRRCLIARDTSDAFALRDRIGDVLLAGEISGDMPAGFHMNNSPAALARRTDVDRPLVMLSSSGTALIAELDAPSTTAYVASLRNVTATVRTLSQASRSIAVIGAGSRGEFRIEDQLGCAWIAKGLIDEGWVAADEATSSIVNRWADQPPTATAGSASVAYLRRSGQLADYEFIIDHVNDADFTCVVNGREVEAVARRSPVSSH